MDKSKQLFEITKQKFGLRFDRELADLLGIKKSTLSQKISRADFPFFQIRQLLAERGLASDWLDDYEGKMKPDSSNNMNPDVARLRDKDQIIQIQKEYIDTLKEQIKILKDEHKKKWNPTIAPQWINRPSNLTI
jgi:transcriptional regulator with XRE-family HTH domain